MANSSYISWLPTAVISIVTTKYLLSRDFHFPLRLLTLHLLGALILRCVRRRRRRTQKARGKDPLADDNLIQTSSIKLASWTPRQLVYLLLYIVGVSGALISTYQALLHWPNLSTLLMILSLRWRPDLYLPPRKGGLRHGSNLVYGLRHLGIAIGTAMIYMCESRLVPVGIVMSLLAAGLAGLADFCLCHMDIEVRGTSDKMDDGQPAELKFAVDTVALLCAVPPSVLLAWLCEGPELRMFHFSILDLVVLLTGIVATATMLDGGDFPHKRMTPLSRSCNQFLVARVPYAEVWQNVISLVFIGVVSAAAIIILGTPIITSFWQSGGFLMATLALLDYQTVAQAVQVVREDNHESEKSPLTKSAEGPTTKGAWDAIEDDGVPSSPLSRSVVMVAMVTGVVCWLVVFCQPLLPAMRSSTTPNPTLDVSFRPTAAFDIVVAQSDEPIEESIRRLRSLVNLPTLQSLFPRIVVYDKKPGRDNTTLARELSLGLPASSHVIVEHLDNVGREGDTYLHHMVSQRNNLAHRTLFMQAGLHHDEATLRRIEDYLRPDTGFFSLQSESEVCDSCEHCHDRYWSEDPTVLSETSSNASGAAVCRDIVLTYKGQFIVSAARIRGNDVDLYQNLLDQMRNPDSVRHAPAYTNSRWHRGRPDSLNAPRFGYTLERMWGALMQCSERRIASRCPTLLSGMLQSARTVIAEDCQCLDN